MQRWFYLLFNYIIFVATVLCSTTTRANLFFFKLFSWVGDIRNYGVMCADKLLKRTPATPSSNIRLPSRCYKVRLPDPYMPF